MQIRNVKPPTNFQYGYVFPYISKTSSPDKTLFNSCFNREQHLACLLPSIYSELIVESNSIKPVNLINKEVGYEKVTGNYHDSFICSDGLFP